MPFTERSNQLPVIRRLWSLASGPSIVIVGALIMIVVYAIDIMTPLGVPVWLLYFIPLFLSFRSSRYYAIPTVCIVTLLFLLAGFIFSPQGVPVSKALLYRFVFSFVFIISSAMLWMIHRQQIRGEILQQF
jgi:hypothetical protein